MKINIRHLSLYLGISALLAGCNKDIDKFIPDPVNNHTIEEFYQAVSKPVEEHIVPINQQIAILTQYGTKMYIDANSFLRPNGTEAQGNVKLQITEIHKIGDMIRFRKPTVSNGKVIGSGGEFNVVALQDGHELTLKEGRQITFIVPAPPPVVTNMEVFYGDNSVPDAFKWIEADGEPTIASGVWVVEDSTGQPTPNDYFFLSDSLHWINCDYFNNQSAPLTTVCVTLPDQYTNVNTAVVMVFPQINAMTHMPGYPDTHQFCNNLNYYGVPVGMQATLVVISVQGDNVYHFAHQDITITENMQVTMSPVETPLADITAYLDGL